MLNRSTNQLTSVSKAQKSFTARLRAAKRQKTERKGQVKETWLRSWPFPWRQPTRAKCSSIEIHWAKKILEPYWVSEGIQRGLMPVGASAYSSWHQSSLSFVISECGMITPSYQSSLINAAREAIWIQSAGAAEEQRTGSSGRMFILYFRSVIKSVVLLFSVFFSVLCSELVQFLCCLYFYSACVGLMVHTWTSVDHCGYLKPHPSDSCARRFACSYFCCEFPWLCFPAVLCGFVCFLSQFIRVNRAFAGLFCKTVSQHVWWFLVCFLSCFWILKTFTATTGISASAGGSRLCFTHNYMKVFRNCEWEFELEIKAACC